MITATTTSLTPDDDVLLGVLNDLRTAGEALHDVRQARAMKDSPTHRQAVKETWRCIDGLLDLYLDLTR